MPRTAKKSPSPAPSSKSAATPPPTASPASAKSAATTKIAASESWGKSRDAELDSLLTPNERIMRSVQDLYTADPFGLVPYANSLGVKGVNSPSPTITVLVLGNHSSGKSSFINWYIGEHIQATGVAMETQGFDVITCGLRNDTLLGDATIQLFPRLAPLRQQPGLLPYLKTHVCASRARRFPMVTFVDTPGLVDGKLEYPFDVDQTLLWFADLADLVLVFLDPIGQSLCKRTMDIVQSLHARHGHKVRYYLTKADQCRHSRDHDRVLIQITQNLAVHIRDKVFDLPAIYIPTEAENDNCPNAIEDVCKDIAHVVDTRVQAALVQLKEDTKSLGDVSTQRLRREKTTRCDNIKATMRAALWMLLMLPLPLFCLACLAMSLLSKGCSEFVPEPVQHYACPLWYWVAEMAHAKAPHHTMAASGAARCWGCCWSSSSACFWVGAGP
eukprot:GAFH01001358.1.p1 GENE.GAFH01001358.1~~GAFH01001358.1.p1  ORF type:complete len:443 (+),score=120.62 GAFH01001358.1:24-1352(+)